MITYVFMIIYVCMPVVSCQVASGPVMSCHELQCNITHALMQFGPTFQAFQCPAIPPSEASTVHLLSGLCQSTAVGPTMPSTWGMAASANASNIISRILYASIYLRMLLDRDCRYLKKHPKGILSSVCTNRTVQTSSNICASSYFNHPTTDGHQTKFGEVSTHKFTHRELILCQQRAHLSLAKGKVKRWLDLWNENTLESNRGLAGMFWWSLVKFRPIKSSWVAAEVESPQ